MSNDDNFEFFQFRKICGVSPAVQIILIAVLFALTTVGYYWEVQKNANSSFSNNYLFVPIYEEVLFRGVMLHFFEKHYGFFRSIVVVSLLFGLWHLKNVFYFDMRYLASQIGYTTLIFSPIMCWIVLRTRSVWPAVLLHYLNNCRLPLDGWIQHFR